MVQVAFTNYLDLKVAFLFILKTCGLIRQKKVNEKMIVSILMDQWIYFISQYELSEVDISKYKVSVVANNKKSRRDMTFIQLWVMNGL